MTLSTVDSDASGQESKDKVLAGLQDMLALVPDTQTSFVIDIREFRVAYKLSRVFSKEFVDWIDDMLTWDECHVNGTWVISNIEWPFYQFSRQASQRLDLTTRSLIPFKLLTKIGEAE